MKAHNANGLFALLSNLQRASHVQRLPFGGNTNFARFTVAKLEPVFPCLTCTSKEASQGDSHVPNLDILGKIAIVNDADRKFR